MNNKVNYIIFLGIFFIIPVGLATIASGRDIYSFSDTFQYYTYFESTLDYGVTYHYEPIFSFLTYVVSLITSDYKNYFIFWFLSIFFSYVYSYKVILSSSLLNFTISDIKGMIVFTGVIIGSNWFYSVSVNGFRQGLSLGFVFISIVMLSRNDKRPLAILCLFISCMIHYSNFLFLPFFFISNTIRKSSDKLFFLAIIFYYLGFTEELIKFTSNLTGVGIYELIKFYVEEGSEHYLYVGFNSSFVIYLVVNFLIFKTSRKFMKSSRDVKLLDDLIISYTILSIFYFVWGFGPFSNRFALPAWMFGAFIYSFILLKLCVSNYIKAAGLLVITFFSSVIYLYRLGYL
ncbi:EpsG family protein [Photobacterium sp. ZSDE20]|nr:EpsG family protein [Photobacterium sp. ZSDE20]